MIRIAEAEKGPFRLFMLTRGEKDRFRPWTLVARARWIDDAGQREGLAYLLQTAEARIDAADRKQIDGYSLLRTDNRTVRSAGWMVDLPEPGQEEIADCVLGGVEVFRGVVLVARVPDDERLRPDA